jgi:hypothetical protein
VKLPAFTTGYTEKRFVLFTHLSHRRRKKSRFSLSFSMETTSTNATARDCSLPKLVGEEVASESPSLAEESLTEELELRQSFSLLVTRLPCEVGVKLPAFTTGYTKKTLHSFHPPLPPTQEEVSFLSLSLILHGRSQGEITRLYHCQRKSTAS